MIYNYMLAIGLMVAQISMARAMEPDEDDHRNGGTSPVTTTSQNLKNVKGFSFSNMIQDIQISILDKWLDLKSIKHLDTAFTNETDRQQLIDTKKFVLIDFMINTKFLFEQEDFNVYFAEKVMDQYNEFKGIRTLEIPAKCYNSSIHINKTIVQLLMEWIRGSSEKASLLENLSYTGGPIDFQTIKIDFFQNLRKVKLDSYPSILSDDHVKKLGEFANLEELDLDGKLEITGSFLTGKGSFRKLKKLSICDGESEVGLISNIISQRTEPLPSLTYLNITNNSVTDEAIKVLTGLCPALTELSLMSYSLSCTFFSPETVGSLTSIYMYTNVGDAELNSLINSAPLLRKIHLENRKATAACIKRIRKKEKFLLILEYWNTKTTYQPEKHDSSEEDDATPSSSMTMQSLSNEN